MIQKVIHIMPTVANALSAASFSSLVLPKKKTGTAIASEIAAGVANGAMQSLSPQMKAINAGNSMATPASASMPENKRGMNENRFMGLGSEEFICPFVSRPCYHDYTRSGFNYSVAAGDLAIAAIGGMDEKNYEVTA